MTSGATRFTPGSAESLEFATRRVYEIDAAVASLNDTVAHPTNLSPHAKVRFIAKAWPDPPNGPPRFKFTYFLVRRFDRSKATEIVKEIQDNRESWDSLCTDIAKSGYAATEDLTASLNFLKTIIDCGPRPPHYHNTLHSHLANLQASTPVDNMLPGSLYAHHGDQRPATAYRVAIDFPEQGDSSGFPGFSVHTIPLCDETSATSLLNIPQEHPTAGCLATESASAYWRLTAWLTGQDDNATKEMLWVPVYEAAVVSKARVAFSGRFLGWLFQFDTETSTVRTGRAAWRKRAMSWIAVCDPFSQEFVRIESQAFLALPFSREEIECPGRFLCNLQQWEGWETAEHSASGPADAAELFERHWWGIDDRTICIRLDPHPCHDNLLDYGSYDSLGYLTLRYPASAAPLSPESQAVPRLVRRIRRLAREAARAAQGIRDARVSEAKRIAGNWAHEVKNYAAAIKTLLDDVPSNPASDRETVQLARESARILAEVAKVVNWGFDDKLPRPPDATEFSRDVEHALRFLLYWRAQQLKKGAQLLVRGDDGSDARPEAQGAPDTTDGLLALALLREVVQNVRNEQPAGDMCIYVAYNIATDGQRVTAIIRQTQQERLDERDEEVDQGSKGPECPRGIRRAIDMFGDDGFRAGGIKYSEARSRCGEDTQTVREAEVYWHIGDRVASQEEVGHGNATD